MRLHILTRRRLWSVLALAIVVLVSSAGAGCATIVSGTTQGIRIESEPPGADVLLDGENKGVTPIQIKVSRKQTSAVIRVEKTGYAPASVPLTRGTNGAITWDFVFGGIQLVNQGAGTGQRVVSAAVLSIGTLAIDLMAGGAYTQKPDRIHIALRALPTPPPDPRR